MNKNETVAIIRSILSSSCFSYNILNLNKDFKKETGIDIPLFGYNDLADFLHSIPETVKLSGVYPTQQVFLVSNERSAHIVSLVKRQKNGKFTSKNHSCQKIPLSESKISERRNTFQNKFEKKGLNDLKEQIRNEQALLSLKYFSLKESECTYERIPPIDIRRQAQVGDYIELSPCQIFNPHKFYFHLRKFKKNFEYLMNKIQIYYADVKKLPIMTNERILIKQTCAVWYKMDSDFKWYRAEIQEIVNDSTVEVNFVDFGWRAKVSKKNLRMLPKNFASLPAQACLASLANIKPIKKESEWSDGATKKFYELAYQKDLIAGIVYVESKRNFHLTCCLGVALSNTGDVEVHINDTLVKEGFAEFETTVSDFNLDSLEFTTSWNISKKCFKKGGLIGKETKCCQELFSKNNTSMNLKKKNPIPAFYYSNVCKTNDKLKQMFSFL